MAAWTGISGDKLVIFDEGGPDFTKLEPKWLKEHIQIGPLGKAYPNVAFVWKETPLHFYTLYRTD